MSVAFQAEPVSAPGRRGRSGATRTNGWDHSQPDACLLCPSGYDDIPKEIPDPDAKKPEDWDDAEDGEWTAPNIPNPEYKGEWEPKMISNPNYKGVWEAPEIDNPDFKARSTGMGETGSALSLFF